MLGKSIILRGNNSACVLVAVGGGGFMGIAGVQWMVGVGVSRQYVFWQTYSCCVRYLGCEKLLLMCR